MKRALVATLSWAAWLVIVAVHRTAVFFGLAQRRERMPED